MPAFTPQSRGITALWLVLIAPTHEGMARLSWLFTSGTCTTGIRIRGTDCTHSPTTERDSIQVFNGYFAQRFLVSVLSNSVSL